MELTAQHQIVIQRVIAILNSTATAISSLESKAKTLLYDDGDRQGYHDQLRQKAILLSDLMDEVPRPDDLPPPLGALIRERVGGFSFEADRALRLDSVFYMAVLLYPEDHQEGQPNELESFIDYLLTPPLTSP